MWVVNPISENGLGLDKSEVESNITIDVSKCLERFKFIKECRCSGRLKFEKHLSDAGCFGSV